MDVGKRDEISIKIREDLQPILEYVKRLDEYVEKNILSIKEEDLDELELDSILESIDFIEEHYSELLEELLPNVGEVATFNASSKENIEKLEKFKEKFEELKWNLNELSEVLKRTNNGSLNEEASALLKDLVDNTNKLMKEIYDFLTRDIYDVIDKLKRDMEVFEKFYE